MEDDFDAEREARLLLCESCRRGDPLVPAPDDVPWDDMTHVVEGNGAWRCERLAVVTRDDLTNALLPAYSAGRASERARFAQLLSLVECPYCGDTQAKPGHYVDDADGRLSCVAAEAELECRLPTPTTGDKEGQG